MLRITAKLVIVAFAAGALFVGVSQAAAQYPPPVGSLSAAASDTAPQAGADVPVTCTVLNNDGTPMVNEPCTFVISSQPGGASFDGASSVVRNTDADGVATAVLSTGSTPGTIIVETLSGAMTSQVTISTGEAAQQLPATGGHLGGTDSNPWPMVAAAMGLALGATLVVLSVRSSRP